MTKRKTPKLTDVCHEQSWMYETEQSVGNIITCFMSKMGVKTFVNFCEGRQMSTKCQAHNRHFVNVTIFAVGYWWIPSGMQLGPLWSWMPSKFSN